MRSGSSIGRTAESPTGISTSPSTIPIPPSSGHGIRNSEGSLTYYSLYRQQKIALGLEATKNCSLEEAISYLTIAINAAIEEAGIQAEALPSESAQSVGSVVQEARSKSPSKTKLKGMRTSLPRLRGPLPLDFDTNRGVL